MAPLIESWIACSQWACEHLWTQLWQVTLLGICVLVATRTVARNRPHLAHMLWLLILLKCVTPPLWSSPSGMFCWLQPAASKQVAALEGTALKGEPASIVRVKRMSAPPVATSHVTLGEAPVRDILSVDVSKSPAVDWGQVCVTSVCGVWLCGVVVVLMVTFVRWRWARRRIYASGVRSDPVLDALVQQLSRQIGLRRKVRLIITKSLTGPAVVGVFRPLIVLPEVIVTNRSTAQLTPIIAHELLHVRRGDLWTGMLQLLSVGAWWFHPLVWLASKLLTREAERCCDEQVIATIGCTPATYARSLVDVLELKHTLTPVPAFPGVRPVEVTTRRLERIMSLRQGCRRAAPWWCWVVLLGLALFTLPGAAFVVTAAEEAPRGGTALPAKPVSESAVYDALRLEDIAFGGKPVTQTYRLTKLTDRLVKRHKFSRTQARDYVKHHVQFAARAPRKKDGTLETESEFIRWKAGDSLDVRGDARVHNSISRYLQSVTEFGFQQVQVETRFIATPAKNLSLFSPKFGQLLGSVVANEDTDKTKWKPLASASGSAQLRYTTQWHEPVFVDTASSGSFKKILKRMHGDSPSNILMAPKLRLFSGQVASVEDSTQRPFVVGFSKVDGVSQPQLRIVHEGIRLRVRPVVKDDGNIVMQVRCELSTIKKVDNRRVRGPDRKELAIQVPFVTTAKTHAEMRLKSGHTMLLGGIPTVDRKPGSDTHLVLALTTTVIPPQPLPKVAPAAKAIHPPAAPPAAAVESMPLPKSQQYVNVYAVADLVTPLPTGLMKINPHFRAATSKTWQPSKPDFSGVQKLIRTTISPSSWENAGGEGTMQPYEKKLSLVISQTEEVHQQIQLMLKTLRRMQDLQTTVGVQIYKVKPEFAQQVTELLPNGSVMLNDKQLKAFKKSLQTAKPEATGNLKVTLFNGQGMTLPVQLDAERKTKVDLSAVMLEDHSTTRLSFAVDAKDTQQLLARVRSYEVSKGGAVLIDVNRMVARAGGRSALENNPYVQQMLRKARDKSGVVLVVLRPVAIVQEPEEDR